MIYLRHLGKQGLIGKYPNGMKKESEVCGKIPTCRPQRLATTLLPAVSLHEKSGVLGDSEICRILPKLRPFIVGSSINNGIRVNIQLSRKRQRAVAGKPNNDPSLSSPHVEFATTVSLRTSYRNVYQPNRAINRNDQECCPANNQACSLFRGPHAPASLIKIDYPTRYGPITSNISPTLVAGFCADGLTLHSPLWYAMRRPARLQPFEFFAAMLIPLLNSSEIRVGTVTAG